MEVLSDSFDSFYLDIIRENSIRHSLLFELTELGIEALGLLSLSVGIAGNSFDVNPYIVLSALIANSCNLATGVRMLAQRGLFLPSLALLRSYVETSSLTITASAIPERLQSFITHKNGSTFGDSEKHLEDAMKTIGLGKAESTSIRKLLRNDHKWYCNYVHTHPIATAASGFFIDEEATGLKLNSAFGETSDRLGNALKSLLLHEAIQLGLLDRCLKQVHSFTFDLNNETSSAYLSTMEKFQDKAWEIIVSSFGKSK